MSAAFVLVVAAGVFLPFVKIAGPFSMDDILPLAAVLFGAGAIALRREKVTPDRTLVGFTMLAVVALFSSTVHAQDLAELFRMAGKSTGRILFYAVLVVVTGVLTRGRTRAALAIFAAVASVEALLAVTSFVAGWHGPWGMGVIELPGGRMRAQGTFGGELSAFEVGADAANFLAAYMMMSVLVTGGLLLSSQPARRPVYGMALGIQFAALLLTYTRASLIALVVGAIAMGGFLGRKRLAGGLVLALCVLTISIPSVRRKFMDGSDRAALYYAAAKIAMDHPIAGTGEGRYETVLYSTQDYVDTPFGRAGTTAHNSMLQSAAQYGVLGGAAHLVLYLLAAGAVLRLARRSRHRHLSAGLAGALVAVLCQDFFNNLMFVPKVATQAWLLFGMLAPLSEE